MPRWALATVLVGCTAAPPPAQPGSSAPLFTMDASSLGPLTSKSAASLVALRRAFAGFDVVPVQRDSLEYRVSRGTEVLMDIVPDFGGGIFSVHVHTPEVAIANRPWRVGAPFTGVELISTCECWADQTVCFKEGEHVAVALAKRCREGAVDSAAARQALVGVAIRSTIWTVRRLEAGGFEEAGIEGGVEGGWLHGDVPDPCAGP
jgi:hypothetical protein